MGLEIAKRDARTRPPNPVLHPPEKTELPQPFLHSRRSFDIEQVRKVILSRSGLFRRR